MKKKAKREMVIFLLEIWEKKMKNPYSTAWIFWNKRIRLEKFNEIKFTLFSSTTDANINTSKMKLKLRSNSVPMFLLNFAPRESENTHFWKMWAMCKLKYQKLIFYILAYTLLIHKSYKSIKRLVK
jgi:hypothetical protein